VGTNDVRKVEAIGRPRGGHGRQRLCGNKSRGLGVSRTRFCVTRA
jgi:hypothetical protein